MIAKPNPAGEKLVYKEESFAIQGAIFEVYRLVGSGFLEAVYQECLEFEFREREIPHICQPALELTYKGYHLQQTYRPDFLCFDKIIIELKAVKDLGDDHRAQVFNYLRAGGYRLGLLVNFCHVPKVTIERIVL